MPDVDSEKLVIRHAPGWDGAADPTREDIRRVLADIESGACERPEFTIEYLGNWEPAEVDGQRVLKCAGRGCSTFAATHYQQNGIVSWHVTFRDDSKTRLALSTGATQFTFIEGIICGGPLTIRSDCIVDQDTALNALDYFARHRAPSPDHSWIPESESYSLD